MTQWRWHQERGRTFAAFTDRTSGNLAHHVGDAPERVSADREAVASAAGAEALIFTHQVHSGTVVTAEAPWSTPPEADAIVTTTPGLFLGVMVADCVPVVLTSEGVVAVAHAGRAGMVAGIATRTVETMRRLGAGPITAHLGPSICARCYEVPAAMRQDCAGVAPLAASITRHGTPALDLAAGVASQLVDAGAQVEILPGCTAEDESLFSHRREPGAGRFIGLVGLR